MSITCLNTEIRKLKPIELYTLGIILSISDDWKKLMAIVPKQENFPKFNNEHVSIVDQAAHQYNRNAAEIFLEEWSTMGKMRPTLETLLELLIKARLFRAADYVACDILKQEKPKRPDDGPAASVDTSDAAINKLLEEQQMLQRFKVIDAPMLEPTTEQRINEMYLDNKTLDNSHEDNKNVLDVADNILNHEKSADIVSPVILSDLMKFSMIDADETVNKCKNHTSALTSEQFSNLADIDTKINKPESLSNIAEQYYICQEVSSQELPIFLNNPILSTISNEEEMSSSDLPLCLKQ